MYDEIVIGARSAGAATALNLARRGHRVLLVDRATFPSDTPTGHYIHQPAIAALKRWGLLDRIIAAGTPAVRDVRYEVGPVALRGWPGAVDGQYEAYAPRQTVLTDILARAAVEAGAEFRDGFSVREFCTDGDRVVGIKGSFRADDAVTEHARIVIGADGVHSALARTVRAPEYHQQPPFTGAWWSYWSGLPRSGVEFYIRDGRALGAFPTNDGLSLVFDTVPHAEIQSFRADIDRNFDQDLDLAPDLAERVRAGRREERWYGNTETRGVFRRPYGAGWALVGDAGYHKDPITGQGITDAFRDAELLADAVDAGTAGTESLETALAGYEQRRNQAVMPIYELTCNLASLTPPPPDLRRLLSALQGNQQDTDRFLGLIAGATSIPEFFAPENLNRIMQQGVTV